MHLPKFALHLVIVAAVAVSGFVAGCGRHSSPTAATPATQPTSKPVAQQASAAASQPAPLRTYVDVIRSHFPDFPATQPSARGVDLSLAGHVHLREPVYLDSWGHLWITRHDATTTDDDLRNAGDGETTIHVVREPVAFVYWRLVHGGRAEPLLICPTADGAQVLSATRRQMLPFHRDFQWNRAMSAGDLIFVPTSGGVSAIRLEPEMHEEYCDLHAPAPATRPATAPTFADASRPQLLFDARGLLAWIPASDRSPGGSAARYVDDHWVELSPNDGWQNLLHLVPLLDGSVLQIHAAGAGKVSLALTSLDAPAVDEQQISDLVIQLSDEDPHKREAAYQNLTRYGPGLWPVLEKLMNDQPPDAQERMRELLGSRAAPTLGGMTVVHDKLRLLKRMSDGGALFYADDGVRMPRTREDAEPQMITPAWLSIRPGHAVELLPASLVEDQKPLPCRITVLGEETVVADPVHGPSRFMPPSRLAPLLRKGERDFTDWIGIDARGRWLFRRPDGPTTRPGARAAVETIILDPTLPDPTPRLAVWQIDSGKSVGWSKEGWPVVIRDDGTWALEQAGWVQLTRKPIKELRPAPPAPVTATDAPTTAPSTGDTAAAPILLVDDVGRRYYDGKNTLTVVDRHGDKTVWPLPGSAVGSGDADAHLVRTGDGLLFLFNAGGRILRIRPTPEAREPFKVEASFTNGVPDDDHPLRVWLDPAGRIDIAYEDSRLAVLFPSGQIPPQLVELAVPAAIHVSDE